ncbi:class GN sortase [Sedimenticola selenatireducens]|uniref:Class GN sortase n=1 Tax=Sedimenticola selenatireducens TaxID=191960 RepID=A0A557S009_9GAMM|nr:class GN sortase [Sedimenticola selenatireducens]TVO70742.1 class GN sortase [Sedimenticola selenatireducens]TVT65662.1 MAG: class GN sortase [Sedimenticola selenatireducens]
MKKWTTPFITFLVLVGLWQISEGGYIKAKALLAQQLLKSAWEETQAGNSRVRPWPWADTWPVARMEIERLGIDQIVLEGSSGRSLAFGPGHIAGTAPLGGLGNSAVSGHRDTHFQFLQYLQPGDQIRITPTTGESLMYAVIKRDVYDEQDTWLLEQNSNGLTLITCYPFDALIPGGPGRFVVRAIPVAGFVM